MMLEIIQVMIAQVGADAISGPAGWVGAGLLGLVLSWLLFVHLPAKDKQLKEMIGDYNTIVAELHKDCTKERSEQFKNYEGTLNLIAQRSADSHDKNSEFIVEELRTVRSSLDALRSAIEQLYKGVTNAPR